LHEVLTREKSAGRKVDGGSDRGILNSHGGEEIKGVSGGVHGEEMEGDPVTWGARAVAAGVGGCRWHRIEDHA
jgi:hypothetical protein